MDMPLADPMAMPMPLADMLEVMPTSPFIVTPFIDPLVIPTALAPGWRNPDGTLAPNDPSAWSVRETHFAGATPTGDPVRPFISLPGPGVNQQDSIGFVPAVPGLYEQHDGQHQVWPNEAGQNSDRLVGLEGGPYPDPILYHIRVQAAEHSFTSSRVQPITALGTPVPPESLPAGVVVDADGTAALPNSTIYAFNGTFPGPMINTEYGKPVLVRFENDLDLNPLGLDRQDFGDPEQKFLTHLHNAHSAPESDGNPFYMQQNMGGYLPGQWSDNLYLNYPAGGDPNEKQSFFWFHDHTMHYTGANVYKGMVGLYPIYDPKLDPGDERDPGTEGDALHLPGIKTVHEDGSFDVKYDIPMAFYDVALDDGVTMHGDMHTLPENVGEHPEWWGKSFYQHFADSGLVGDIFTVNGTAFPVLHVTQREYRFRFLDASVSRIYELALMTSDAGPVAQPGTQGQWQIPDGELWKPMTQIASMGGLLPEPIERDSVQIWPATRNEHVVDFRNAQVGDVIYLTNILEMPDGRKPNFNDPTEDINLVNYKVPMVKIIVDGPPPEGEEGPTSVPSTLRPMPVLPSQAELDTLPHPSFTLARSGMPGFENQWLINDVPFNPLVPLHTVTRGQPEVWTVINGGGGWVHPMHMHMEEHTVLSRTIPPNETPSNEHPDDTGKSDIVNLDENESVSFYRNFRTFTGRYVGHCHNLLHEDHSMMFGWTIEEAPDTTRPTVTINQAADQPDPTNTSPINFTVEFSEPVTGFTGADVSFTDSTATGILTATVTGSGTTYIVAVSGMTGNGSVIARIEAEAAQDAAGNLNTASTSTDNIVSFTGINVAPTDILWNGATPAISTLPGTGATIANLSTVDPDSVSWTYSLQAGSSANFAVSAVGAVTRTNSAMAANQTYTVIVTSDDGAGGSRTETFTIRTGSNGANTVAAATANDTIVYGDDGNDILTGGVSNDTLFGMDENDTLNGSAGNDVLNGGTGDSDTASYAGATGGVTVSLAIAGPQNTIGAGFDTLVNIENLTGSSNNDTLTGNNSNNVLNGGAGGDILIGGDGNDTINTGAANDDVPDIVRWSAAGEFGDGDTVNNFDATGTAAQIDRIEFSGALNTLFDNGTIDGSVNFFTGNGANGGNIAVNLAVYEALFLDGANGEGVRASSLARAAAVAAEFNAEFNLTAANGEDTLLVINDTNANSASIWRWVQARGGEISAGELTRIGIINASATVTTGSFGFVDLGPPLLASSVRVPSGTAGGGLDPAALQSVSQAAIANWASQGLPAELTSRLRQVRFVIADMPGSYLGMAVRDTIYLAADAAGHGWFVDRTPTRNEEFRSTGLGGELRAIDPRAVDRIDLMTVVSHELGHIAGLDDLDLRLGNLMSGKLSAGMRRTAWSVGEDKVLGFGNIL